MREHEEKYFHAYIVYSRSAKTRAVNKGINYTKLMIVFSVHGGIRSFFSVLVL